MGPNFVTQPNLTHPPFLNKLIPKINTCNNIRFHSTDSSIITRAIDNMSYIQQSAMKQNGRRHNDSISVIKDEHDSTTNICARSFVKLPLCCGVA